MDLFDQLRDDPPPPTAPLSVSELTAHLRELIETAFASVLVDGEISNCRQWSSGHIYFTLKDDHAQVRAVMFRTTARTLRIKPEDGMHVLVRGRIGVYDAKGEYQIICDALEPHGLGARQAAFEALKRSLQLEGLFDAARKRPLPVLPRRIGVVTSLDGAAVRDIVRVLTARYPGVSILIRSARVQGDGAAADITRALKAILRVPDVDVIIVGRGGGSAEDLSAFNDEGLARAICASPVPIISAVGHEVDFTIADFVADVRAATPSNAAELVVARFESFSSRIERAGHRVRSAVSLSIARRLQRAMRAEARLRHWPANLLLRGRDAGEWRQRLDRAITGRLSRHSQRFDRLRRRIEGRDLPRVVAGLRHRFLAADARVRAGAHARRLAASAQLGALAARLDALSPLAVLARGYAVCWNASHDGIIRSAHAVAPGATVHVTLAEGELRCRVEDKRDPRV